MSRKFFLIIGFFTLLPSCFLKNKVDQYGVLSDIKIFIYDSYINDRGELDTLNTIVPSKEYFLVVVPEFINQINEKWSHSNSFVDDSLKSISFYLSFNSDTIHLNKALKTQPLGYDSLSFKTHYNSVHFNSFNEYKELYNEIISGKFDGHYIDLGDEVGVNFYFTLPVLNYKVDTSIRARLNLIFTLKSGRKVISNKNVFISAGTPPR